MDYTPMPPPGYLAWAYNKTFTLLMLSPGDIAKFVGEDGSLIRKHVVKHACNTLLDKSGLDDPDPHVSIKVVGRGVVVAECCCCSEELESEVMRSLAQYQKNFMEVKASLSKKEE
jgi:hypothetical protein